MWTEEDQEAALAWQELQDATCKHCGNPFDESMNPDNDGAYTVKTLVCHGCRAVQKAAHAAQESDNADVSGRQYVAVLERGVDG